MCHFYSSWNMLHRGARVRNGSLIVQAICFSKFVFEITISFLFYGLHRLELSLSFISSRQCQLISLGSHKDSAR